MVNPALFSSETPEWSTPQGRSCASCGEWKPVENFPRSKNRHGDIVPFSYCRECVKRKNRGQYLANRENRLRSAADYRAENTEKVKISKSAWKKKWRKANPEKAYAAARIEAKAYRLANPEKENAREQVKKAVRSGLLVRGGCTVCGSIERIEGHHKDYSRPLDVTWLCKTHHIALHKGDITL